MPITLDRLPFDVVFRIAYFLGVEDLCCLGATCKHFSLIIAGEPICRQAVERFATFTLEATDARRNRRQYFRAFRRLFERRTGFATLQPSSCGVLAPASDFIYLKGMLCYIQGLDIRLLDIHKSSDFETVLSISRLLQEADLEFDGAFTRVTLLNYSEAVLSILVEDDRDTHGWLVILRMDHVQMPITRRVDSSYRIFVANDSRYLYAATHSEIGSHGHHEWVVRGLSLSTEPALAEENGVQLRNLVGGDIGSNVAFTIHNGYFYALSNVTSFELEEIDYTSFYTCMRFPVDQPSQEHLSVVDDIYRRQHSEGAINDSWTDLALQVCEQTNALFIVEARREYLGNTSAHQRTYYIQPVPFNTTISDEDSPYYPTWLSSTLPTASSSTVARHPANDVYIPLLTAVDKPRYAQPRSRPPRETHPEYCEPPSSAPSAGGVPEFLLWQTKFRTYSLATSTFVDIVEDDDSDGGGGTKPCLRLRGAGRRLGSPLDEEGRLRQPEGGGLETDRTMGGSEERFVYGRVRMWPPRRGEVKGKEKAGEQEEEVTLPYGRVVKAVADERSLVYSIGGTGGSSGEKIVLVNFDPGIRIGKQVGGRRLVEQASGGATKGKDRVPGGESVGNGLMWREEAQYVRLVEHT
ncbi:MAG: hypothetical protein M1821_007187 [Bathelium mastoideum]|nr:MAG: hypothetical protein M1821_007187 [Bathelium mastoideum]